MSGAPSSSVLPRFERPYFVWSSNCTRTLLFCTAFIDADHYNLSVS